MKCFLQRDRRGPFAQCLRADDSQLAQERQVGSIDDHTARLAAVPPVRH